MSGLRNVWVFAALICALLVFSQDAGHAADAEPGERIYRSVIQEYGSPLSFRDTDGTITGFSVEVMDAVAVRAGLRIRHTLVATYGELLEAFRNGTADMTPSNAISPDRLQVFDFTTPYESIPLIIFVRSDTPSVQSITPGMVVGAVRASAAVGYLKKIDGIKLVLYPGYQDVITALLDRRIDAFTASAERVRELLQERGVEKKIKAVGHPIGVVQRAVAVKKGNEALRERLDAGVKAFVASPDYARIHEKWFGPHEK